MIFQEVSNSKDVKFLWNFKSEAGIRNKVETDLESTSLFRQYDYNCEAVPLKELKAK